MIPKLSKVLSQSEHEFRERDFTISCKHCCEERNLSTCTTRVVAEARTYRCNECGSLLVVVGYPSERPVSSEHCRPGTWWSVHPVSDLFVQVQNSRLTIPPCKTGRIYGAPLL